MLEERKILLLKMSNEHREERLANPGNSFHEQAVQLASHIEKMMQRPFAIKRFKKQFMIELDYLSVSYFMNRWV